MGGMYLLLYIWKLPPRELNNYSMQLTIFHFAFKENVHDYTRKQIKVQETKKFGCTAQILVREDIWFPTYKVCNHIKLIIPY